MKKVKYLASMPVYVDDFLSSLDVSVMTAEEIGAYFLLLLFAWNKPFCQLQDENELLSRITRTGKNWLKVRKTLMKVFKSKGGKIYSEKQKIIRKKIEKYYSDKHAAGVASGKSRRNKTKSPEQKHDSVDVLIEQPNTKYQIPNIITTAPSTVPSILESNAAEIFYKNSIFQLTLNLFLTYMKQLHLTKFQLILALNGITRKMIMKGSKYANANAYVASALIKMKEQKELNRFIAESKNAGKELLEWIVRVDLFAAIT